MFSREIAGAFSCLCKCSEVQSVQWGLSNCMTMPPLYIFSICTHVLLISATFMVTGDTRRESSVCVVGWGGGGRESFAFLI